jgi:mRNA interferase MazF
MMPRFEAPDRGDALWLDLDPQAGREEAGRRPVLVLSPASYNARVSLVVCCQITSRVKGYPFEVALPDGLPISGGVLADQVKSLDWKARRANRICVMPADVVSEVPAKLHTLL